MKEYACSGRGKECIPNYCAGQKWQIRKNTCVGFHTNDNDVSGTFICRYLKIKVHADIKGDTFELSSDLFRLDM